MSELVEERDFLLRSLRDLDAERAAGDIEEADYHALKDEYTARAAAVLRALDEPEPPPVVDDVGPLPRRSLKAPIAVLVVVGLAVLAGWAVASSSGDRTARQAITGILPAVAPAHVSITARLGQAQQLIVQQKLLDAVKLYDSILKDQPNQPEALAYKGWLLYLAGLVDQGLQSVTQATTTTPSYTDAHFFRGKILCDAKHDGPGAIAEYRLFFANVPPTGFPKALQDQVQGQLDAAIAGGCKG